ncbi:MAG: hypothetical protein DRI57_00575 [Deltaproteobacteria bacterium]|nr:MAG: hypothetical protein DRI57_00575 [Deltaproteobacteria bacterium]
MAFMENREISAELWKRMIEKTFTMPAFGVCDAWDNVMYETMVHDKTRLDSYRNVIKKWAKGKKVVDIDAGATLPMTLICAEAGAESVYAVVPEKDAANQAEHLLDEKGLSHKVRIIEGDALDVDLPEKVDICVSEIIGEIGGCEGAAVILQDAKRFLKDGGIMLPDRCVTKMVPVSFPDNVCHDEFADKLVRSHNVEHDPGTPGSCYRFFNFPESHFVSEPQIFEDIRFNESKIFPEFAKSMSFPVLSDTGFDGLLLWINLYVDSHTMIDGFRGTCWAPFYMSCDEDKSFTLKKEDVMNLDCTVSLHKNSICPDYIFKGKVYRNKENIRSFSFHYSY